MSELSFCFESNQVRVLGNILNPLFVALDICKALGFGNPYQAIKDHVDSEDISKQEITDNMGRKQEVNCVNESGMYALIFGSKLPNAKRFKKWVTSEVLPAIRKTGQYSVSAHPETITPAQQLAIQQAVGRKAQKTANHYQTIYRAIKLRYQIARYDQLPQSLFEDCLRFIETVDLHTPEVVEQPSPLPVAHPEPKDPSRYLTDNELSSLDRIHRFHRDPYFKIAYEVAYNALRAAHSRYAGRFYDVMTECDLSLFRIGRILERNGIEHF